MAHLRSAASWSTLVLAAALAAALPACGGGSKKTVEAPPAPASTLAVTCADAAAVLGPLGAAQLGKDRPDAEAVRLAVEEVVRAECAAGPWSPEVLACVGEATADTVDGCHKLLPDPQADAFDAALDARMKALLSPPVTPPGGGGKGSSDDAAEGGSGTLGGSNPTATGDGVKVERKTRGRKVIKKDTAGDGADPCDGGEADPDDGGEADPCDGGEADGGFFRR